MSGQPYETDEEATDEEATDEEATDEEATDEEATDEEATDEEAMDEEATDEEAMDEDCHILPLTGLNAFVYTGLNAQKLSDCTYSKSTCVANKATAVQCTEASDNVSSQLVVSAQILGIGWSRIGLIVILMNRIMVVIGEKN